MVNFDTIRFIKMLDDLAEISKNEIILFSEMTDELRETNICYDEEKKNPNGTYKMPLDSLKYELSFIFPYSSLADYSHGQAHGVLATKFSL